MSCGRSRGVPGEYALRLVVDGKSYRQPLVVEPDPRSRASAADLAAQQAFALGMRDRMSEIAAMAEKIRALRRQLEARNELAAADPESELYRLGVAIVARLDAIEGEIHNPRAEVSYDILAGRGGGAKLYSRLSWLFEGVKEHDGPPTQGMEEVSAEIAGELAVQQRALADLLAGDVARLNALAAELGVDYVVLPGS